MTILTRYLLRTVIGPFLFAFISLTGLLFVNVLSRTLEDLVGKGLPLEIIIRALALTLPHTIALTLPMAVLTSVLYAVSHLAVNNEIMAVAGTGAQPRRILLPLLAFGLAVSGVTFLFNDIILPEANHELKNLRSSIRQKSPTFLLRERVFNPIPGERGAGPYYLRVDEIDPDTDELRGVRIHDLSGSGTRRTTTAKRAEMRLNSTYTDLHLRLFDGESHEVSRLEEGAFSRTGFEEQLYVLRNVGDTLEASVATSRGDREMGMSMLFEARARQLAVLDSLRAASSFQAEQAVLRALGRGAVSDSARAEDAPYRQVNRPGSIQYDFTAADIAGDASSTLGRYASAHRFANRFGVEIHKKLVISTSCIIFVLLAVPVAIRVPRGGVNMVIVVSSLVLGAYQAAFATGESRADEGLASPFWAMWGPSMVFLALGIVLTVRMGRWTAATRGSSWRETWLGVKSLLRLPSPAERTAAAQADGAATAARTGRGGEP